MNKSIIGGVIVGALLPVMSFGITPAREAILGLAPDEQILQLADKIDETRVSTEQATATNDSKIAEMQAVIDAQNIQNEENKKIAECADLQSKYIMCNNQDYRKSLDDYLKNYLNQNIRSDDDNDDIAEWKQLGVKNWNICQTVYNKCN